MPSNSLILPFALSAVSGYLLGSISFSIIITWIFDHKDVRNFGSGNAGATNVMRAAGKVPALLTFVFDFLKCVAAIVLAMFFFTYFSGMPFELFSSSPGMMFARFAGGIFCLLGHIFPLYFQFRGGKGVTTSAAIIFMINPWCFLVLFSVFLIVLVISHIVSLSSIIGMSAFPLATLLIEIVTKAGTQYIILNTLCSLFITAIVVFMHRSNIKRLRAHTEPRLWGNK